MRKKLRRTRKRGAGGTALDPNAYKQTLHEYPGAGSTANLAAEALAAQAERRREKAEAAPPEDPPRKSSESSASDPMEFQENPLEKLKRQRNEPSANFKGTVGKKSDPKISFFGVQRHTTTGARRSRKNKKRKTRRRR